MTSSGGHRSTDAQCLIFSFALLAFTRFGLLLSSFSEGVGFVCLFIDVTSRGYNFVIRRFVCPVVVLMFAARKKPSLSMIKLPKTASLQFTCLVSSCTCTTSPTLIPVLLFPEVLWNSRNAVKYSCCQRFQKCSVKSLTGFALS